MQRAEPGAGGRTPAAIPNWSVRGRYPGSQVLVRRLPRPKPSGNVVADPHLLTVAGAAEALPEIPAHLVPV